MDIYKKALLKNLLFETDRGMLTLPQAASLGKKELSRLVKYFKEKIDKYDEDELSFLDENDFESMIDPDDRLRFEIVKDLYLTRKEEQEKEQQQVKNKEHNEKIMRLIEQKQDQDLGEKSVEELKEMLK